MITILNTSTITAHGSYTYKPCSLEQAKKLIASGFQSAIGHESTAAVISTLLGAEVKMNRIQYQQLPGDTALVFKLKGLAQEGKVLTVEEIEEIGYEWGILERTDSVYDYNYEPPPVPLGARISRYIKNKCWWTMDYIIMPVICFFLAIGFVAGATTGLEKLFSM